MSAWGQQGQQPTNVYPDAQAWLRDWFAQRWARSWETGERIWCPAWREHPEAVSRLEAMWASWEYLQRRDLARWWLDVADPMMAALTAQNGAFQRCTRSHTARLGPLPLEAPDATA